MIESKGKGIIPWTGLVGRLLRPLEKLLFRDEYIEDDVEGVGDGDGEASDCDGSGETTLKEL
jgi:hypothetical protein